MLYCDYLKTILISLETYTKLRFYYLPRACVCVCVHTNEYEWKILGKNYLLLPFSFSYGNSPAQTLICIYNKHTFLQYVIYVDRNEEKIQYCKYKNKNNIIEFECNVTMRWNLEFRVAHVIPKIIIEDLLQNIYYNCNTSELYVSIRILIQ